MKKILFKTVGWILVLFTIVGMVGNGLKEQWMFFIMGFVSIWAWNGLFNLGIEEKATKIREWFLK